MRIPDHKLDFIEGAVTAMHMTVPEQRELVRVYREHLARESAPQVSAEQAMTLERDKGAQQGWQPIETAPKDGRVILAWRFYPVAIRWIGGQKAYPWEAIALDGVCPLMSNGFAEGDPNLTHWQPIPGAPQ